MRFPVRLLPLTENDTSIFLCIELPASASGGYGGYRAYHNSPSVSRGLAARDASKLGRLQIPRTRWPRKRTPQFWRGIPPAQWIICPRMPFLNDVALSSFSPACRPQLPTKVVRHATSRAPLLKKKKCWKMPVKLPLLHKWIYARSIQSDSVSLLYRDPRKLKPDQDRGPEADTTTPR
jgi:hypothetical protein